MTRLRGRASRAGKRTDRRLIYTVSRPEIQAIRIEWDESQDGHFPLVVVRRKEVSWNDLGQMLMSMEGWQFRLDIAD
jgi:hypothetical protein